MSPQRSFVASRSVRPHTLVVTRSRTFQVKDVARLAGVSVRTLHHYDSIGLLVPRIRTDAGYRLYTDADLLRLQQILIGRDSAYRSKRSAAHSMIPASTGGSR